MRCSLSAHARASAITLGNRQHGSADSAIVSARKDGCAWEMA